MGSGDGAGAFGPGGPRSRVLPGLLVATLVGCTAPAPYTIAPGNEGAPGVRRVLVCSSNIALALPSEITGGAAPVQKRLVGYLEEQGLEVEHLGLREGRRLWREAAHEASQQDAEAGELFAKRLAQRRSFDALVMPSLVLHGVRVTDNSGTWDGVRRSVEVLNRPSMGPGGSTDTFTKGVAYGGISGEVMATSLHVVVFSPEGRKVFEGRGGLEFTQEADMSGAGSYHWELRTRGRLHRDPEIVSEGVELALSPYLPRRSDR